MQQITATPWRFKKEEQPEQEAAPKVTPTTAAEIEPISVEAGVPRAVKISRSDLTKHGYTAGCRKCDMLRRGDNSQPSLGHTLECRRRKVAAIRG